VLPAETVILAGPTGAGKSALAIRLAALIGGEIVGADAFQIYAGLGILTAQTPLAERGGIPHHLVGSVDPSEPYDAGRYLEAVRPVLRAISSRGRVPIVVGGTGLYVKALLGGLDELPGSDPVLREEFSVATLPELIRRLRGLDPEAVAGIDLANRRRVERALEIVILTGGPLACARRNAPPPEGLRALLLTRERDDLNRRIEANVESMFARGVEAEVATLPEERVGPTATATLGLREIRSLLRGETGRAEAVAAIVAATRRYAKRQGTWFRNQHSFTELILAPGSTPVEGAERARRMLGF
jgi:tRNA dimethylallyltransferase